MLSILKTFAKMIEENTLKNYLKGSPNYKLLFQTQEDTNQCSFDAATLTLVENYPKLTSTKPMILQNSQ